MEAKNLFVGIDLGGQKRKTTGICILKQKNGLIDCTTGICILKQKNGLIDCKTCQLVTSPKIIATIKPYLKDIRVIAVDGPLTIGKGKGAMRLYEKFLSTKVFRQHRVQPLPPALMSEIVFVGVNLTKRLKRLNFMLDKNLIEVFPTLNKALCKDIPDFHCPSSHQVSASICAWQAWLHWHGRTRWIGHKDGLLFIPEPSLWKKQWRMDFTEAWQKRSRLKYRYLRTNFFG